MSLRRIPDPAFSAIQLALVIVLPTAVALVRARHGGIMTAAVVTWIALYAVGSVLAVALTWVRDCQVVAGRGAMYGRATARFGGARVSTGRRRREDIIDLPGPPCPARVRYCSNRYGGRRRDCVEFSASLGWGAGRMWVTTDLEGRRDAMTRDEAFDERFLVRTDARGGALEFLDAETRARVERLRALGGGFFLFETRPGATLVRVTGELRDDAALRAFIDECYGLVSRLAATGRAAGVEIMADSPAGDGECQVCGTQVTPEKRVLCRKCRTPHDADCWAYNDGCSTFACGERRSVRG